MMKVSDPIIFGHAVEVYFAYVFAQHGDALRAAGANPRDGLGDVLAAVERLDGDPKIAVQTAIANALEAGPDLATGDPDRGITNLTVQSAFTIDRTSDVWRKSVVDRVAFGGGRIIKHKTI